MTSMKISKETIATTGVIGAALLAASCCLAPALFILFGVSAGALTRFTALEPYRPLFMATGGLCLLAAAWWIYGRRAATPTCADGQCAPHAPRPRRTRLLFWISAAAFAAAVIYPLALGAGIVVATQRLAAAQSAAAPQTFVFRVDGMTCALCTHAVEKALRGVDGVVSNDVDPAAGRVVVTTRAGVQPAALQAAMTGAGYPAELLQTP